MDARTRLAQMQRDVWRNKRAEIADKLVTRKDDAPTPIGPSIARRSPVQTGSMRADFDTPVPFGRWAWFTVGLHVGPFWVEAMQRWRAARL